MKGLGVARTNCKNMESKPEINRKVLLSRGALNFAPWLDLKLFCSNLLPNDGKSTIVLFKPAISNLLG